MEPIRFSAKKSKPEPFGQSPIGTTKSGQEVAAWVSATPYVLIWLPVAVAVFYLKYVMMATAGFLIASRHFGRSVVADLSPLEKLSFFRSDLLYCFLLVPLALLILARILPRSWRTPIIATLCVACLLAIYADVMAFHAVGRLLSSRLLVAAFLWGLADRQSIAAYIHPGSLVRVGTLIASLVVVSWWSIRQSAAIQKNSSMERRWRRALVIGLLGSIAIVAILWLPGVPSTSYHESILLESVKTLMGMETEAVNRKEFIALGPGQLVAQYRELTHAPPPAKDPRYWGKAAGSDVIVVVLETGPAASLDIAGNLDDMPVLQRLRQRSFVAIRHYSTYPYTSRAHFSLFSSWYPSNLTMSFEQQYPHLVVPGIMRLLSATGYETANYSPYASTQEPDEQMYQAVGFRRQLVARPKASSADLPANRLAAWNVMRSHDSEALILLKKDVGDWIVRGQRFAVAFLPLEGHGPWPDVNPDKHLTSIVERGRAIIAMQDSFLGELVTLLENHQRLERTIIVVTADHGVRTHVEDPSFQGGMIDDYSFHVPLLIYAPQALHSTERVSWLTSHIDIQPTVLDLLGIEQGRDFEQGSPIWDPRLAQRTTFFFANHFLGADGYYSDGEFFMRSPLSDSVYQNDRLHFTASDMVTTASASDQRVTDTMRRMVGLQQRWIRVLGQPQP
jgi:phosphoglycerol transferase MdoB-like AlkP superfamily enzyme